MWFMNGKNKCSIEWNQRRKQYGWYDPHKQKYQFLTNEKERDRQKHFDNSNSFLEIPDNINDIYKIIENWQSGKNKTI